MNYYTFTHVKIWGIGSEKYSRFYKIIFALKFVVFLILGYYYLIFAFNGRFFNLIKINVCNYIN